MADITSSPILPAWINHEIDADRFYGDDDSRMQLAIYLAQRNVEMNTGGPFGAAIFSGAGQLIGVGVNRVLASNCSIAHAEMLAFINAQTKLKRNRLNEDGTPMILATSSQPCCMCYGASFWAGLNEMLIGARSEDVHALTDFDEGPLPADWLGELNRRGIVVRRDLQREAARTVLAQYSTLGGKPY